MRIQPVRYVRHLTAILLNVPKPTSMPEMQSDPCVPYKSIKRSLHLSFVASPMQKLEDRTPPARRNLIRRSNAAFFTGLLLWQAVVLFCGPTGGSLILLYCREALLFVMGWLHYSYSEELFRLAERLNCALAYSAVVGLYMGQVTEIAVRKIYAISESAGSIHQP